MNIFDQLQQECNQAMTETYGEFTEKLDSASKYAFEAGYFKGRASDYYYAMIESQAEVARLNRIINELTNVNQHLN